MADRDRPRDRGRDRDRDRERRHNRDDRDRDRGRDLDRERTRSKRSKTPDRFRSRSRSRSRHARSRSPDERSRRRRHHRQRSPSAEKPHKRHRRDGEEESEGKRDAVWEFVEEIVKEQEKKATTTMNDVEVTEMKGEEEEAEMMRKLGIPLGFDSTKGKPVAGADVSGVRALTKRQPRQYMNRRGGFNRPLPAETNR